MTRTEKILAYLLLVQWEKTFAQLRNSAKFFEKEAFEVAEMARREVRDAIMLYAADLGFVIKQGEPYPQLVLPVVRELCELLRGSKT